MRLDGLAKRGLRVNCRAGAVAGFCRRALDVQRKTQCSCLDPIEKPKQVRTRNHNRRVISHEHRQMRDTSLVCKVPEALKPEGWQLHLRIAIAATVSQSCDLSKRHHQPEVDHDTAQFRRQFLCRQLACTGSTAIPVETYCDGKGAAIAVVRGVTAALVSLKFLLDPSRQVSGADAVSHDEKPA